MKKIFKNNPFFRWSFVRMFFPLPPDGREAKLVKHVLSSSRTGDPLDAIRVIDQFAREKSYLINVGDKKGEILDNVMRQKNPRWVLELGTYCGYSALRMAIAAPSANILTIEFNPDHAAFASQIIEHAGLTDRISILVGTLGDEGQTINRLIHQFKGVDPPFEAVFIDHDKSRYLPDLQLLLENNMLADNVVVVADNVGFPGAPEYKAFMDQQENIGWITTHHESLVEYQSILKDVVLVSEKLGP